MHQVKRHGTKVLQFSIILRIIDQSGNAFEITAKFLKIKKYVPHYGMAFLESTGCPSKFWTAQLGRAGGMVDGGMGGWSLGDHITLIWFPSETIGYYGIFQKPK